MRPALGVVSIVPAVAIIIGLALPALAQNAPASAPASPRPERNVSATGRVMPPATGRTAGSEIGSTPASIAAEMQKAQKAAETRNKAWDSKMRKTMGSICTGC